MDRKEFTHIVREAVAVLPETARRAMENVAFVLEDQARRRRLHEIGIKRDQVLLGLYEGVPKTRRGAGYFGVLPDKITLFREPIEAMAGGNQDRLRQIIHDVVWHEIGHHLGFDEYHVRALERKRRVIYP